MCLSSQIRRPSLQPVLQDEVRGGHADLTWISTPTLAPPSPFSCSLSLPTCSAVYRVHSRGARRPEPNRDCPVQCLQGVSLTCSFISTNLTLSSVAVGVCKNSEARLAECITVISIVQFRPCEDMIPLIPALLQKHYGSLLPPSPVACGNQNATDGYPNTWQRCLLFYGGVGGGDPLIRLLRLTARLINASQQHKACFDETKRREIIQLLTQKGLRYLTIPCDMSSAAQKQSSACLVTLVSHPYFPQILGEGGVQRSHSQCCRLLKGLCVFGLLEWSWMSWGGLPCVYMSHNELNI